LKKQEWQYGLHAVQAMLKTDPVRILEIKVQRNRDDERINKVKQQAEKYGIPVSWAQRKELDKIAEEGRHQGVVALCKAGEVHDDKFLRNLVKNLFEKNDRPPFLLILDCVTDPHNLGAVLRSADAAGIDAVVAPKDGSVGITPVVSKVACGAAETVPFVVVTNLVRTMKELQGNGIWIIGTAGEADAMVYDADLKGPLALVMGAEEKGMRRLTRDNCDVLVKLPMAGSVSSLNVSVAAGVCLFEAVRQRG
jgi:23S rRNA (guanosine2251-2'-O)-methyltransferase